jgi:hypothetical protein
MRPRTRPKSAALAVTAIILAILACDPLPTLDTSLLVPMDVSVEPPNVCPGDQTTVNWSAGSRPPGVFSIGIASDPPGAINVSSTDYMGSEPAGPINADTTFHFSPSHGWSADDVAVKVILPPPGHTDVPVPFSATCAGSSAAFPSRDVGVPIFRANGVRMVWMCNGSGTNVDLVLTNSSGVSLPPFHLAPFACTPELDTDFGNTVKTAAINSAVLLDPALTHCETDPTSTTPDLLPHPIPMTARLVCDRMSAVGPIVAATEDLKPTATSDLVQILPTDTPGSPIPTILLTQNSFCRKGPATVYEDTTAFEKGQELVIDGRNDTDPRWWWVRVPNSNGHCWISFVAGTTTGDPDKRPVQPTEPPPPQEEQQQPQAPDCAAIVSDATCNATPGCSFDYVGKKCLAK